MPNAEAIAAIKAELILQHGTSHRARIERGVDQVARLWRQEDGDVRAFAVEHFLADPAELDQVFARFETSLEQLDGHLLAIGRELRRPSELDLGPLLKVDGAFAAYDPWAHVVDDFFANKLAFIALLNFPLTTLEERTAHGRSYSRRQWAEVRLAGRFGRRVPANVHQDMAEAAAAAELYISEYNIWMHHLLDGSGRRLFPKGLRLLAHWDLRDEIKASYAEPSGVIRQRMIVRVMERIVDQTIPRSVVNNPGADWNPYTNVVTASPAEETDGRVPERASPVDQTPEGGVRYERLLAHYRAARQADRYSPTTPTQIARAFELGAEMPEGRVTALLTEVLTSSLVPRVASYVERSLGRRLEPHDLWFSGFVGGSTVPEAELDTKVGARYPNATAFAEDIPRILQALGFSAERARWIGSQIVVDPARGSGHALQAARRGDSAHLRTRIEAGGMNYKGYNVAIHELGHNVEQVVSLYDVDHTLLAGVPNTAFTEALAFVFQARDLELLGYPAGSVERERLRVLNDFWVVWEISGIALVDIAVWHWMYDHPDAGPSALGEAVMRIAREYWNTYYAPVLGGADSVLLGIYSHMVNYPLYLFNYPLGHLIASQIGERLARTAAIGPEFERIAKVGAIAPDLWMEHATGAGVSAAPLLRATEAALLSLEN